MFPPAAFGIPLRRDTAANPVVRFLFLTRCAARLVAQRNRLAHSVAKPGLELPVGYWSVEFNPKMRFGS
jgi:hypothetical protein